jgi:hypothetical protein
MTHVDGNALAGALSIAFGTDVTAAESICGCGRRHAFAEAHVYMRSLGMVMRSLGMVMRCPNFTATEVLVDIAHQVHLNVRSLAAITLDPTAAR